MLLAEGIGRVESYGTAISVLGDLIWVRECKSLPVRSLYPLLPAWSIILYSGQLCIQCRSSPH